MIRSSLCNNSDAYIHLKGIIKIEKTSTSTAPNNANKNIISKNSPPFTNCISKINNTQADDTNDIDVVIPLYNLIEYRDIYSKISGRLFQYYRDIVLDFTNNIIGFLSNNSTSILFKFKRKITGKTGNDDTKVSEIVPLKYLSNVWRTLEML